MALPKVDYPIYEVTLLSKKNPVKFRPFLVKEQKLMMMAVEAKDIDTTIKSVKQIINNCVLEKINVDDLPLADIETMFLNLRARSMGEVMSLYYKCTNRVGAIGLETNCGMVIEVPVNLLNDVKQINIGRDKKIMLSDDIGVVMRYPSLDLVEKLVASNVDSDITTVASCIETIFDTESVHNTADATPEEVSEFVESLESSSFEKLRDFVNNTPKARFETKKKCPKCGFEHDFVLEGLSDFFT